MDVETRRMRDGRIAYPSVVQYRRKKSGRLCLVPPKDGGAYTIEIADLDRYTELCADGRIRLSYPGPGALIDNRRAT